MKAKLFKYFIPLYIFLVYGYGQLYANVDRNTTLYSFIDNVKEIKSKPAENLYDQAHSLDFFSSSEAESKIKLKITNIQEEDEEDEEDEDTSSLKTKIVCNHNFVANYFNQSLDFFTFSIKKNPPLYKEPSTNSIRLYIKLQVFRI